MVTIKNFLSFCLFLKFLIFKGAMENYQSVLMEDGRNVEQVVLTIVYLVSIVTFEHPNSGTFIGRFSYYLLLFQNSTYTCIYQYNVLMKIAC